MKRLLSLVFTLLLASNLLLSGCSTSHSTETPTYRHATLAEGKANFKEEHYSLAYHQLLPLAVKGNPDAQYAIGYMYYYGKGIDCNEELAENWLRKAAKKGQSQAVEMLKEFSNPNQDEEEQ
jgi:TPR repeat protein